MNLPPNAITLLRDTVLRRWLALAFLLSIAAAYASPLVQPRSFDLVCGTHGTMKLLSHTADGEPAPAESTHCSLCAPAIATPPELAPANFQTALTYATQQPSFSAWAALTRPPLPARGPPDFS